MFDKIYKYLYAILKIYKIYKNLEIGVCNIQMKFYPTNYLYVSLVK